MGTSLLPDAGEISSTPKTVSTQKGLYEDQRDTIAQLGGANGQQASIIAGIVDPGQGKSNFIQVDTEGQVAADNLDGISHGTWPLGSTIVLRCEDPSRVVTVRHDQTPPADAKILTANGQDFVLDALDKFLIVIRQGSAWAEIARNYGADIAGWRSYLGLGSVATLDDGTVDAATLQGNDASAFLPVGGTAADSAQLEGNPASAFLSAVATGVQVALGALQTDGADVRVNNVVANASSVLSLLSQGTRKALVLWDDQDDTIVLREEGTAGNRVEFVIDMVAKAAYLDEGDGAGRKKVWTGNDFTKSEAVDVYIENLQLGTTSASWNDLPAGSRIDYTIGRAAFFPDFVAENGQCTLQCLNRDPANATPANAHISIRNQKNSGFVDGDVGWEYIKSSA